MLTVNFQSRTPVYQQLYDDVVRLASLGVLKSMLLVIFYTAGVDQWACIGFGAGAASMLVFYTFRMNARYGEHGLMKLAAARRRPRYLINRKGACRFLNRRKEVRHA